MTERRNDSVLTVQRFVERCLWMYGARIAVVDGDSQLTYADLSDRSARLANALVASGATARRPVATLLPNTLEFIEVDVACARAGMTRVGLSDRLSPDECAFILGDSEASVLITNAEHLERLGGELPDSVALVVSLDGGPGVSSYEALLADSSPRLDAAPVDAQTPNYILYTSGTTGRPKGATHTHGSRVAAAVNMLASELRIDRSSAMIHAGPLTHGSGSKLLSFLGVGGRNIIMRKFDPEALALAVTEQGGTHTFLVPTMIQRLLEAGPDVRAGVSSMSQISFGGAPISPTLFRQAIEGFGPILTQVYGSCEAPHPVTVLTASDYLAEECSDRILMSAGRVAHGVDVRFVENGRDVGPGEVGELLVRGAGMMSGYWQNEEATAAAFDEDGWYSPGDLATVDADGIVTFRDRKRELIITGGLNVYPSEVERVIGEHPDVREVAVIGAPDDEWGEVVLAYVVAGDRPVTGEEIIDWTRDRLASYKKPKRVEFLERLPLGSSNKVLKRELRDALWRERERGV